MAVGRMMRSNPLRTIKQGVFPVPAELVNGAHETDSSLNQDFIFMENIFLTLLHLLQMKKNKS